MILNTSYRHSRAGELMDYIEHEAEAHLRGPDGKPIDSRRLQRLLDRSQQVQFERHLVFAPDPDAIQMDRDGLAAATTDTLNSWTKEMDVEYAFTVHTDSGNHPHVHAAIVGDKRDLYMDTDDIKDLEQHAQEQFQARQRQRTRGLEQVRQHANERGQDHHREPARDHGRDR